MMRTFSTIILSLLLMLSALGQNSFKTDGLEIEIDNKATIIKLIGDKSYLPQGIRTPLLSIKRGTEVYPPISAIIHSNLISLIFEGEIQIDLSIEECANYLRLELTGISGEEQIDAVIFGPYSTTINETIGEIVGVVRDKRYAIGLQSLNAKTTGGILNSSDGSDPARGTAAIEREYGSSLQAYCINRDKDRVYNIWDNKIPDAYIKANKDGELKGSAIALFGCKEDRVLDLIEKIELAEGLPHSSVNGVWAKKSRDANRPYLITTFTEETIDDCLEITERLGYQALYHSHPFSNWGHFDLIEDQFPNGWDGMKSCVEKASLKGIRLGAHTLTNFITTNDKFVSPLPHRGLMQYSKTRISREVSETDSEIYIENASGYDFRDSNQAIRLGNEIIRFAGVSEDEPLRLVNCKRGQYGTTPGAYAKGAEVARLVDHPYKVFFPDWEMQKEMINNLADFFNYTGIAQLDFDGHEGGWGTGEGEFGMDYFSEELQKQVKHELRNGSSRSNHYYWHTLSYINWGEPWYGGFTKSQGHYRYKNQALLKRNYIPNMLGWFLLNETTTLEEFEFMLARSAGYDAGYALTGNIENFKANSEFESIVDAINTWEQARLGNIFNPKQLEVLRDVENEFSLKQDGDDFKLQYFTKIKFDLLNEPVQPGQPNDVSIDFNVGEDQPLYIVFGAVGEEGSIEGIDFILNGFEEHTIRAELKPNWAISYRGDNKLLIYDEVGRLKSRIDFYEAGVQLKKGSNNIRVSADFKGDSDIKLSGYIRLKDKIEVIRLMDDIID